MTEYKFTDDEIIKALECCSNADCVNCPKWGEEWYSGMCADFLPMVLDLINRQKAEIEDLEIKNEHLVCFLAEARRDAIKEFAERLKEKIRVMDRIIIYGEDIDNLVKEMTE